MASVDDRFLRAVAEAVRGVVQCGLDAADATRRVREVFVEQNSGTPDNREAAALIAIGETEGPNEDVEVGLTLTRTGRSLPYVFWQAVETDQVAALVSERFPDISFEEAGAMLRVCTVVLSNLQGRRPLGQPPDEVGR